MNIINFDKELLEAEKEAREFLLKVQEYKNCDCYYKNNDGYSYHSSKDRATVKRKSMDLSNSLVKLRKASVY